MASFVRMEYLVLILATIITNLSRIKCESDTLALFSISNCPKENNHHCRNARNNEKRMRAAWKVTVSNDGRPLYQLCTIDVENSFEIASELILELLNEDQVNYHSRCIDKTANVTLQVNKTLIFTYIPFEMTRFIASLLLLKDVDPTLVAITTKSVYPSGLFEKDNLIFSYEGSFEIDIQHTAVKGLRDKYGVSYSGVIYLKESDEDLQIINKPCHEREETAFCFYVNTDKNTKGDCLREIIVDYNDDKAVNETINFIMKDPHLRVLIVYGFGSSIHRFVYNPLIDQFTNEKGNLYALSFERSLSNSTFLSEGNEVLRWDSEKVIQNIPGEHAVGEFLKYVYNLTEMFIHNEMVFNALKSTQTIDEYITKFAFILKIKLGDSWNPGDELNYAQWMELDEPFRRAIVGNLPSNRFVIKSFIQQWKQANYLSLVDSDALLEHKYFNPSKAIDAHPFCNETIPQCGKGEELRHSFYTDPKWNNSYGWHCRKCPENTFKDRIGNSLCEPCLYPYKTDFLMMKCFDPFESSYPKQWGIIGISVLVVMAMTALSILALMLVFFKFRDTPIVKHANRSMTALHLVSHLILNIVPFLFFGEPNQLICYARPMMIGVCFTINVSVNIAKTQKLHLIFNSKTLHSRSKKTLIGSLELMIIGGLLLIDSSLFLVGVIGNSPGIIHIYHNEELVKEITCSNNSDTMVQLFFFLFLVLVNGIQAFRSRSLPSHFKETNHVIYSSFISILMLSVVTILYFLQNKATTRNIVLGLAVLNLNIVNFVLIYSYKLFVILVKPQLNTTAAFNAKRKKKLENQFTK